MLFLLRIQCDTIIVIDHRATEFVGWMLFWGELLCCPAINGTGGSSQSLFVHRYKRLSKYDVSQTVFSCCGWRQYALVSLSCVLGCECVFVLTVHKTMAAGLFFH